MKQYCLSKKSTRVTQNKSRKSGKHNCPDIIQMMAWVATRPLGQHEGSHRKDWNMGIGNLKLNHRHFIFSGVQPLLMEERDNIGFHCATGGMKGPGAVFSENWQNFGYTKRDNVSSSDIQDRALVQAINNDTTHEQDYHIITHNCQDWVDTVRGAAGL